MNRIYFEALMVTIKMGEKLGCIFFVKNFNCLF